MAIQGITQLEIQWAVSSAVCREDCTEEIARAKVINKIVIMG
jgi:hypothetical protein